MAVLGGRTLTAARSHGRAATARGRAARVLAALLLILHGAAGAVLRDSEYQLKAAFLLNFARFVEWPPEKVASPPRDLVIGILGEDPFGRRIDQTVAGKLIDQRNIRVARISSTPEAAKCDVVFIAGSEVDHLQAIINDLRGKPVLTVSDIDGFVRAGGMIGLKKRQDMIRFEINRGAAEGAGLRISSKLLKLSEK